ncbi:MAG: gamma-glutamylcyclotransferase [Patescibacteria group bacterium]|nr:gamma-glutamylcyclotransferase [Patescibacteria group bacterium]
MYYFAYGSNMVFEQMRRLCGHGFTIYGPAKLVGYEFGLDKRGYFNVRPRLGAHVYGVLYEVTTAALAALDEFEGHPGVFARHYATAETDDGRRYEVAVYMETAEQFGGSEARPEFLKRVLAAATECHLPQQWIKKIRSFEHV